MSRDKILYDMDDLNKKSTNNDKAAMAGIKKINDIVVKLGGTVRAPVYI